MPRGMPQVEVVFDIDANGILNVSATEKSTNKSNKITITNDKGRLSPDEIERMVQEAEKYKAQDDALRENVDAKNKFESYLYQLKSSVSGELKDKLSGDDKSKIDDAIKESESWLDNHPSEEKSVYESKQKELENVFMGIMKNMQGAGQGGQTQPEGEFNKGSVSEEDNFEPKIEEID